MFQQFRPVNGVDKYVWLAPYQAQGGNLMLVGAGSMESFLEQLPNYMAPLMFDTAEEIWSCRTRRFRRRLRTQDPAGRHGRRARPHQYPYATAGLATLDWTSSSTKYVYAKPLAPMSTERRSDCAGVKALVWTPTSPPTGA